MLAPVTVTACGAECTETFQVGNGIELDTRVTVGRQFEPYLWRPCGVAWDVVPEQSW